MKKLLLSMICFCLSAVFITSIAQTYQITGTLSYHDDASKELEGFTIELRDDTHKYLDDCVTGQDGSYEFSTLDNGTYYVCVVDPNLDWGGNNSMDALLISQHINQTITLTGFELLAADCMEPYNQIDGDDWTAVCERFVYLIDEFDRTQNYTDWVIQVEYQVVVNGGNEVQDLETICYGDVNSSYIP